MLELNDPRWADLSHCYGSGENIPPFLQKIADTDELGSEFWDELTNILCHQCSTGSASASAFCHLVKLAGQKSDLKTGFDSLCLAALILAYELGPENNIERLWESTEYFDAYPEYLRQPVLDAIENGKRVVEQLLYNKKLDYAQMMRVLGVAGVFGGFSEMYLLLPQLGSKTVYCVNCDDDLKTDTLFTY